MSQLISMKVDDLLDDQSNVFGDALEDFFNLNGITGEFFNKLRTYIETCFSTYKFMDYHLLPIQVPDASYIHLYFIVISNLFNRNISKYMYLFTALNREYDYAIFNNLNGSRKISYGRSVTNGGNDTITNTLITDNSITNSGKDETSSSSKDINEVAPINNDIDSIDSPNYKEHTSNNSSITHGKKMVEKKDETATKTNAYGKTETEGGNDTYNDPYMYEVFMRILKENNVYDKIHHCIKSIIYEFNTAV